MSFSWVPFYQEVAGVVLGYEDRQADLIALIRKMGKQDLVVMGLKDYDSDDKEIELRVMDPFTFFANWNRHMTDANRQKTCLFLKQEWGLAAPVPTDFDGIPLVNPMQAWFLPYERTREADDVSVLWRIARSAFNGKPGDLDEFDFKRVLQIRTVGVAKLTMGLFWISASGFLPLDKNTVEHARAAGVEITNGDLNKSKLTLPRYREILGQIHDKMGHNNLEIAHNSYGLKGKEIVDVIVPLSSEPLNRILYGPPGTGKTFNAIPRAVGIIDGEIPEDRAECQRRFDELRREGRIGFVTFHQSFSYEEFIEGLRPKLDGAAGEVRYEVRDGVLKEMALRSLDASTYFKSVPDSALERASSQEVLSDNFSQLWNIFASQYQENPTLRLEGLSADSCFHIKIERGVIRGTNILNKNGRTYDVTVEQIKYIFERLPAGNRPSHNVILHAAGLERQQSFERKTTLVGAILLELWKIKGRETKQHLESDSFAQSPLFPTPDTADFQNAPRYVLIIDEINRGNISRILGELITLLEEDKRLGAPNELRVTLPVSLETFALPPNLYLLGTMNTADKSLALLDIALRRRFVFEEIRPDFRLPELKLSETMREVLEKLNLRLEYALDREHCLGHAYFMGVETPEKFNEVFRDKIIPLLQEFFYNDWETLRGVLGENAGNKGFIRKMEAPKGMKGRTLWRWWFDVNRDEPLDCLGTLVSNYAKSDGSSDGSVDELE